MKKKKVLLALTSSFLTLLVLLFVGEVYERYRQGPGDTIQPGPFDVEFLSGRGDKISDQTGPLHLVINPYTVYSSAPSQRTAEFAIDSHGFRTEEGLENDRRPKIVILGGSSAFGLGVKDPDTISSYLEREIPTHRLINAGVVGYLSGQELGLFVNTASDYRPQLVIAYDGWNDLYDPIYGPVVRYPNEVGVSASFLTFQERLVKSNDSKTQLGPSLVEFFRIASSKSYLLKWATRKFGFEKRPRLISECEASEVGSASRRERNEKLLEAAVDAYVRNLTKLSNASHAYGAEFIVVIQPELGGKVVRTESETVALKARFWNCYRDEFPELYKRFVAAAKLRLTQVGIPFIDLNEAAVFRESNETLFFDVVHTTELGNQKAVSIILPQIKSLLAKHQGNEATSLK